jgi:hypothetical protein
MAGSMTGRRDNIQLCLIYWRCGFTVVCMPGATRVTTKVDIQQRPTYYSAFSLSSTTSHIPNEKQVLLLKFDKSQEQDRNTITMT